MSYYYQITDKDVIDCAESTVENAIKCVKEAEQILKPLLPENSKIKFFRNSLFGSRMGGVSIQHNKIDRDNWTQPDRNGLSRVKVRSKDKELKKAYEKATNLANVSDKDFFELLGVPYYQGLCTLGMRWERDKYLVISSRRELDKSDKYKEISNIELRELMKGGDNDH